MNVLCRLINVTVLGMQYVCVEMFINFYSTDDSWVGWELSVRERVHGICMNHETQAKTVNVKHCE